MEYYRRRARICICVWELIATIIQQVTCNYKKEGIARYFIATHYQLVLGAHDTKKNKSSINNHYPRVQRRRRYFDSNNNKMLIKYHWFMKCRVVLYRTFIIHRCKPPNYPSKRFFNCYLYSFTRVPEYRTSRQRKLEEARIVATHCNHNHRMWRGKRNDYTEDGRGHLSIIIISPCRAIHI